VCGGVSRESRVYRESKGALLNRPEAAHRLKLVEMSHRRTPTNASSRHPRALFVLSTLDSILSQKIGNVYVLSKSNGVVIGPHWPGVLVTIALIFGGTMLNLQVVDTKFPTGGASREWMRVLVCFLFASTLGLFLKTATTDPGIVYPGSLTVKQPHVELSTLEAPAALNFETGGDSLTMGDRSDPLVFCDLCEVYSPEKFQVHHCYDCGTCIEGMDHHCPW